MKVKLKQLSACKCGFPALKPDIQLGHEYDIDPQVKQPLVLICGGCGQLSKFIGVYVEPGGFLPEVLFSDPAPAEQKIMKLTDILNDSQLDEVEKILNNCGGDRMAATKDLRSYLGQFKVELEAKGVNSDYLAYVIAYRQWTGGDNGDRVVAFSA